MFSIPLDPEILTPCFMSLGMFQSPSLWSMGNWRICILLLCENCINQSCWIGLWCFSDLLYPSTFLIINYIIFESFIFKFQLKILTYLLKIILIYSRNICQRRLWHATPVLLPGKSHRRRSLVGCSPWDRKELNTTEWLHFRFSLFTFMHWRRKWQPTPVFLPGESQGRGSLVGCCLWGRTE